MAMPIIIAVLIMGAIIGAMKVVHAPRHCRTCGERIDGVPELEDRRGNCWHFECWQAEQVRMRKFSAKIAESKLPNMEKYQ
jgi:hypothetical protein